MIHECGPDALRYDLWCHLSMHMDIKNVNIYRVSVERGTRKDRKSHTAFLNNRNATEDLLD